MMWPKCMIALLLLSALAGCAGTVPPHYSPYAHDDNSILHTGGEGGGGSGM